MKVVFLFGGLPHYYTQILNKLNQTPNLEIIVYYPDAAGSLSVGKSVFQDKSLINFKTVFLKESKSFFGKGRLEKIKENLAIDKPDLLIAGWPYITSVCLDFVLLRFLKKNNIKLFERSIPFQIPKYQESWEYFKNIDKILTENLKPLGKKSLMTSLKYWILTQYRRYEFNKVDGHLTYIPEGIEILSSYGVPKDKIHVTLNSPITSLFLDAYNQIINEEPILVSNPHRVIHIGRLVKWKRVDLLIGAIELLKIEFPNIHLVIVGDGPELSHLELLSEQKKLTNHISFVGAFYKPEEIGRYLLASSVYVLAGTGGLSINDAMCFSKPIICSECDGTEKLLVKDGQNGYFFKNGDLIDLASKIKLILSDIEKANIMGAKSLEIINNEVNENIVISNYLKAFKTVKDF